MTPTPQQLRDWDRVGFLTVEEFIPCGVDNGPLRVIGGTHDRILDSAEIEAASRETQTVCAVGVGGLLMMRPLVLHASSPAVTASHRRVVHVEFGPAELPGGLRWAAGQSHGPVASPGSPGEG